MPCLCLFTRIMFGMVGVEMESSYQYRLVSLLVYGDDWGLLLTGE